MTPKQLNEVNDLLEVYGVRLKGNPDGGPYDFEEKELHLTPEGRFTHLAIVCTRLRKREESINLSKPQARLTREDLDLAGEFGRTAYWLQEQIDREARQFQSAQSHQASERDRT